MSTTITALWQAAQGQFARKDWRAAKTSLEAILALQPGQPAVMLHLSYVESYLGNYRAARELALAACAKRPAQPTVVMELLARLRTFNASEQMFDFIEGLPPLRDIDIRVLLTIAAQLSYLNLQKRALPFLDEAARGDPDFPPTLLARAQVLVYLGRFADAMRDLEHCLERAPELPSVYWHLSRINKATAERNHVAALRGLLDRPGKDPEHTAICGYALHYELDALGRHDEAWQALETACRAKRALLNYDLAESRALVDDLIAMPASVEAPSADAAIGTGRARTPIFIVGMHRSGTTLLEQLLDGHSGVKGVGELYDFTSQMRFATDHHCRGVIDREIVKRSAAIDYAGVGKGYLDNLEWRLGAEPCFTDKLPSNFLNIGFICRALPQARILHLVRDPVETCFSNLRELFSDANPYSYDQRELAGYFLQYRRLMAHWHQRWPGRILDVGYADLTRDTERTLRRVCDFCGIDFEPGMVDLKARDRGVATASAIQVRQGIIARSTPKWAPYERQLTPLREALAAGGS